MFCVSSARSPPETLLIERLSFTIFLFCAMSVSALASASSNPRSLASFKKESVLISPLDKSVIFTPDRFFKTSLYFEDLANPNSF